MSGLLLRNLRAQVHNAPLCAEPSNCRVKAREILLHRRGLLCSGRTREVKSAILASNRFGCYLEKSSGSITQQRRPYLPALPFFILIPNEIKALGILANRITESSTLEQVVSLLFRSLDVPDPPKKLTGGFVLWI
jgi:hypothetical protein